MLTSTRKQNPELVTSRVPITNTVQPQDHGSLYRVSCGHGAHHQHQKHMVFLVPRGYQSNGTLLTILNLEQRQINANSVGQMKSV